ncbi:MAG: class I SAM-dependent methyltransferase [Bernardetiaceae bacterium]|jgi:predicted O-methyltransferase YrrM|nr:class I SAM-dependent methyltransferase [Bernardetiaceae bacterium]
MPAPTPFREPLAYPALRQATLASGFTMASDAPTGTLLRALAASKPGGNFLEIGTGTGLATAWILDGLSPEARLTSVENDEAVLQIARAHLGTDPRLHLVLADAGPWLRQQPPDPKFDFIFADTWFGKYLMLEETLTLLKPGGFYLIDDMLPQPNWPEGHSAKAADLATYLALHPDLVVVEQNWATGIIVAVKRQRGTS